MKTDAEMMEYSNAVLAESEEEFVRILIIWKMAGSRWWLGDDIDPVDDACFWAAGDKARTCVRMIKDGLTTSSVEDCRREMRLLDSFEEFLEFAEISVKELIELEKKEFDVDLARMEKVCVVP